MLIYKRLKTYPLHILLLFLLISFCVSLISVLDYHQFLLPLPDEAAMHCRLHNISKEDVVIPFSGNYGDLSVKHFIGGVNVRKFLECRSLRAETKTFLYQNIYSGVHSDEIDRLLNETIEKYKTTRNRWFYNREQYRSLLNRRSISLDRHGFSDSPLNPYQDYWFFFITMKMISSFFSLMILLFLISLPCCQRLLPLKEGSLV